MSVTWRPEGQQKLCDHHSCDVAGSVMVFAIVGAALSLTLLLAIPSIATCVVTGTLLAVFMITLFWRCPARRDSSGDLEALARATREPAAVADRERAGQRFTGHAQHFDQWEQELKR